MAHRVQVYNSAIHGLFLPGGGVNDEASDITKNIVARAVVKAMRFSRTGTIERSHKRNVVPTGQYGTLGYVSNTAPHAAIKHQGLTEGMTIRSRRPVDRIGRPPGQLKLRAGNGYGVIFRRQVSGYHPGSAEPWLRDAANDVLLRYGVQAVDSPVGSGINLTLR